MKKKGFLVDKLNTYLPHNGSSLSISVQYHAQQSTPQPNSRHNQQPTQQQQPQHVMPASENLLRNIEIKINQVGNSIDYCFVHSPSDCEQTTGKVNAIAKQLINGKGVIDNRPRAMQDVSMEFDSCSVI